MIIFIPSWKDISSRGISTDDLVGQVKVVMDSEMQYEILINEYIPNLRYFLHRYDLLEARYISIFDRLQGFESLEQKRLTINDLDFPEYITTFYSPYCIFVYELNEKIGEIKLGEGGQIEEVKYFNSSIIKRTELYDDRGVISSQIKYKENQERDYIEYLDINKIWIFRKNLKSGKCIVNPDNVHNLKRESYETIGDIQIELMNNRLKTVDSSLKLVVAANNNNIRFFRHNRFLSSITLSFFEDRFNFSEEEQLMLKDILNRVNSIVVESQKNLDKIKELTTRKIYKFSPFDSRFTLSISQELKEEVIYFETRGMSTSKFTSYFNSLLAYLYEAPEFDLSPRVFKLLFRVDLQNEKKINDLIFNTMFQRFPEELKEIENHKSSVGMENTIDFNEVEMSKRAQRVKNISEGIECIIISRETELFKVINTVRIIIDLSEEPDLFTQIAGISAGIPQVNQSKTEYITHGENGWIISNEKELYLSLQYYLESLSQWQEARVYAVSRIREYSGGKLFSKILKILEDRSDGTTKN